MERAKIKLNSYKDVKKEEKVSPNKTKRVSEVRKNRGNSGNNRIKDFMVKK